MSTVIKNIKQYSLPLSEDTIKDLIYLATEYRNFKNYLYSRFSGIKSIHLLKNPRKNVRDKWIKSGERKKFKLPARYWKIALDEVFSDIRGNWTSTKKKIKYAITRNDNLTREDIHYIRYILSSDELYYKTLNQIEFDIPDKFKDANLNFKYLNNLIRRYTRKYKNKIPYTNKNNIFSVDTGLYRYENGNIKITTLNKGKRVSIPLKDTNKYKTTLKIKIVEDRVEVHVPLKISPKDLNGDSVVGLDKGINYIIATSTENLYGGRLNEYLTDETERLNHINSNRNRFYAMYKTALENNDVKKAENILNNNLGKKKYNHRKNRNDEKMKSYINHSLNEFILKEKPKEIVMEDLTFANWNSKFPKNIKRKLSRWTKGYIRERLEYKCELYNIKYTYINPAYTSKVCSVCGSFGKRKGASFICSNCGETHADINAAKNILSRKDDKEINLYTKYTKVKMILESRISSHNS